MRRSREHDDVENHLYYQEDAGDLAFGVHISETYGGQRRKRKVKGVRFRLEADERRRSGASDHEIH